MRTSGSQLASMAYGVATAVLVAVLCACSSSRQPDGIDLSPSPTTAPGQGEVLYRPVDEEFCVRMRWDDIGAEFGMTLADVEPDSTGPAWQVSCTISDINADYLDDSVTALNLASLSVIVFEEPDDAHSSYNSFINAESVQSHPASNIDGWWADGTSRESPNPEQGSVLYHVYHENIVVAFAFNWHGLDRPDAVANVRGMARAVLEEVKVHLPCRSLVDPPVDSCD